MCFIQMCEKSKMQHFEMDGVFMKNLKTKHSFVFYVENII